MRKGTSIPPMAGTGGGFRARWNPDTGAYEVVEIDQIGKVVELLKTDPNSRRMVVTAWEPGNALSSKLPPCHYTFAFNVRTAD